jgi:hypothetical protein
MLSESIVGMIDKKLVIASPESTKGASEFMDAIFPAALHLFIVARLIEKAINAKLKTSGGMDALDKFKDPSQHEKKQKYDL